MQARGHLLAPMGYQPDRWRHLGDRGSLADRPRLPDLRCQAKAQPARPRRHHGAGPRAAACVRPHSSRSALIHDIWMFCFAGSNHPRGHQRQRDTGWRDGAPAVRELRDALRAAQCARARRRCWHRAARGSTACAAARWRQRGLRGTGRAQLCRGAGWVRRGWSGSAADVLSASVSWHAPSKCLRGSRVVLDYLVNLRWRWSCQWQLAIEAGRGKNGA